MFEHIIAVVIACIGVGVMLLIMVALVGFVFSDTDTFSEIDEIIAEKIREGRERRADR